MAILEITTNQNIDIEYKLASVGDRMLATLIDFLVIAAYIFFLVYLPTNAKASLFSISYIVIVLLPVLLYNLLFEILMDGQSLGKRQMKIKVVKIDGTEPTIGSYLLRWLPRMLEVNTMYGLVAIISIATNSKNQRLGDIMAGTTVISLKRKTKFDHTIFIDIDKNYEMTYPQVSKLTDKDVSVITELFRRTKRTNDEALLLEIYEKLQSVLSVRSDLNPKAFVELVLKDYNHLSSKG